MGPASHGHNLSHRSLWGAGTPHTYLITTYCLGHILFFTAANGRFTFATEDYGIFDKCFEIQGTGQRSDQLDPRHETCSGVKNDKEILKMEKLKLSH